MVIGALRQNILRRFYIMLNAKTKKRIVAVVTAALFLFAMSGTAFAKVTSSSHLDYVALGDSIPDGYGLVSGELSYPDRIAAGLADEEVLGNYDNFAESGLTAQKLLDDLSDYTMSIRQAEIITLTVSGDDVLPLVQRYISGDLTALAEIASAVADDGSVEQNLTSIMTEIKKLNKNAEIYIMGYPTAIAANPYLTAEQQAQISAGITLLNARIADAAANIGATYIDTQNIAFADLMLDGIHLTNNGQIIAATDFWNQIDEDFVKIDELLY